MTTAPQKQMQGLGLMALAGVLALYAACYVLLSDYDFEPGTISAGPATASTVHMRTFDNRLMSVLYAPLGWLEERLRGEPVWLCYGEEVP